MCSKNHLPFYLVCIIPSGLLIIVVFQLPKYLSAFPAAAQLFFKVLPAHPARHGNVTFLTQFGIQPLHTLFTLEDLYGLRISGDAGDMLFGEE
ncbi:MAG TPA: hypothetical protein IAB00_05625 [Candidatus Avidehalobacter gallistercoris]|uniref:Uncharacterized protein n=1 Tax=Candidatus Avidehalobacter gallistercoris TaxID=2840694 RepID=A0A9D1HKI1_9FIRM|nr:hypothetical protein [Candidatus Avidehalobacter gallistercoris]